MSELKSPFNPLQTNPTTGEYFLQLPAPHSNIIITTPRASDAEVLTSVMNDPLVYDYIAAPPYPFKPEHAEERLSKLMEECNAILEELRSSNTNGVEVQSGDGRRPLKLVSGCPVVTLREVGQDRSDMYIGDIQVV